MYIFVLILLDVHIILFIWTRYTLPRQCVRYPFSNSAHNINTQGLSRLEALGESQFALSSGRYCTWSTVWYALKLHGISLVWSIRTRFTRLLSSNQCQWRMQLNLCVTKLFRQPTILRNHYYNYFNIFRSVKNVFLSEKKGCIFF